MKLIFKAGSVVENDIEIPKKMNSFVQIVIHEDH